MEEQPKNWWHKDFDKLIKRGFTYWNEGLKYVYLCFPYPLCGSYRIFPNKDRNAFRGACGSLFYTIYDTENQRIAFADKIEDFGSPFCIS